MFLDLLTFFLADSIHGNDLIDEHFVCSLPCALSPPDLISQLMDPVADPWLDQEARFNLIPIPESYTGPHLSFPLSVSDTNALLAAFKEQKVHNMSLQILLKVSVNCLI